MLHLLSPIDFFKVNFVHSGYHLLHSAVINLTEVIFVQVLINLLFW